MEVINPVIKERYIFMTHEDQAAAIGRIVLERKKITESLILLRAEARRLGDELTTLVRSSRVNRSLSFLNSSLSMSNTRIALVAASLSKRTLMLTRSSK